MDPISDITSESIMLFWPALVGATIIALVHLLVSRFRFVREPDNLWVSASAGVALAYVFMDIFPHLAKVQKRLGDIESGNLSVFLENNVYLMALAGFCMYLGIVMLSIAYRHGRTTSELTYRSSPAIVKIETVSLGLYNFLIGYLLSEQLTHRPEPVILFAAAMAIHLAGVNFLMREHYRNLYDRSARFIFIIGVYTGWLTGVLIELSDAALAVVYAFLAGGIMVVATVYELPGIRSGKQYVSFLCGTAIFSALVLAIGNF